MAPQQPGCLARAISHAQRLSMHEHADDCRRPFAGARLFRWSSAPVGGVAERSDHSRFTMLNTCTTTDQRLHPTVRACHPVLASLSTTTNTTPQDSPAARTARGESRGLQPSAPPAQNRAARWREWRGRHEPLRIRAAVLSRRNRPDDLPPPVVPTPDTPRARSDRRTPCGCAAAAASAKELGSTSAARIGTGTSLGASAAGGGELSAAAASTPAASTASASATSAGRGGSARA